MGKSVAIGVVPYVPCSKMKPCDIGSISKSLEAAMVKLQALTKGYEGDVHTRSATSTHGVPREPKPPDLYQGERLLPYECSNSSPTLRSKGKTPLLPSFNGENSRAFVSWLFDVECYFENKCFSDKEKCKLVVSSLKGVALLWYNTLTFSRRMEGKGRICSWFKLERNMRLKFLPSSTMDNLLAELKTLKQNSLSVHEYAILFEELHFVCDNEVSSFLKGIRFYNGLKFEIARRIKLEMMHSYGELLELALCVEKSLARPENNEVLAKRECLGLTKTVGIEESLDQGIVMPCLNIACPKSKPLEPKVMSTYAEMNSSCSAIFESPYLETKNPFNSSHEPTSEEESSHTLSHGIINDQATDLGPREVIVDKRLLNPQTMEFGQSMVMFNGVTCSDSSKGKARRESWVVPHSSVPNLTSYISHGFCFKANILEGITCHKSTPHFHFYMLIRLQVSLVQLGAISYMLVKESKHVNANMSKLFWSNELIHFEKFRGLKYISWVLLMFLSRVAVFEIVILIFSWWKLFVNNEIGSFNTYCPILKFWCFGLNVVQIHCESLLGLFGTSRRGSLHVVDGVHAHFGRIVLRLKHQNRSSPLKALISTNNNVVPILGLDLNEYMLLVIQDDVVVVELRVKTPWPWDEGYMSSIEGKTKRNTSKINEPCISTQISEPSVRVSILSLEQSTPIKEELKHSEPSNFGNGITPLMPYTILVYDPGRSHENPSLKVELDLLMNRRTRTLPTSLFNLIQQNLRANSFEEREFATKFVAL